MLLLLFLLFLFLLLLLLLLWKVSRSDLVTSLLRIGHSTASKQLSDSRHTLRSQRQFQPSVANSAKVAREGKLSA